MIRNRIIFAVLWVLSVVGISFFGGPISYGFFTLLTLLPIISLLYLLLVSAFFRIYQEIGGRNLVANQPLPFYFILKNEYFFGFSSVRVYFFSSFSTITDLDDGVEYELSDFSVVLLPEYRPRIPRQRDGRAKSGITSVCSNADSTIRKPFMSS